MVVEANYIPSLSIQLNASNEREFFMYSAYYSVLFVTLASSCEAAAEISSVNKNRIKTNFM
jgi:hypothetical protein